LLALSAATAAVTLAAQASLGATKMLAGETDLPLRIANAVVAYVKYLAMTVWPDRLAVFYPYDFHPSAASIAGSATLLAVVTIVALARIRRAPYLAVGWFWYLGTLVPTIGLVQVGAQGLADRYTYLPSIGIFLAAVWAAADIVRRRPVVAIVSAAMIAALLVATHRQAAYWADSERLFRQALAVTGDNPESCENLGDALLHRQRYAEAEVQFRKVLKMDAEHFRQTPPELAQALAGQNRISEALALLHETIPDQMEKARAMNDLALFLGPRGHYAQAIELLEEAVQLAPRQPAALNNLASIYATCPDRPDRRFRNGPKAVELARRACELTDWSNAAYRVTLADAYLEIGDRTRAIEELHAAQKLNPKDRGIAGGCKDYPGRRGNILPCKTLCSPGNSAQTAARRLVELNVCP